MTRQTPGVCEWGYVEQGAVHRDESKKGRQQTLVDLPGGSPFAANGGLVGLQVP